MSDGHVDIDTKDVKVDLTSQYPDLYERAEDYWANASKDVDGMLGGFAQLHRPDINHSRAFLSDLHKRGLLTSNSYALDCGCGIGRVTKDLLLPAFKTVDMVDVIRELIEKSDSYLPDKSRIGEKFVEGLQTFAPPKQRYDLIWIQWVSGYLTNDDFVMFFKRCRQGLKEGGVICLKDNIASSKTDPIFDSEDYSWTRPEELLRDLFGRAHLKVVSRSVQNGFPPGMYKVCAYALKPWDIQLKQDLKQEQD